MKKLILEPYSVQKERLPESGSQVIAQYDEEHIVVYQAYKPSITKFASLNQQLGGDEFGFTRMSWIKPNFLWMMFRSGWATKVNQECILAIWLNRQHFERILANAVHTSFQTHLYDQEESWKKALASSEVRLQWDPDHDPFGQPVTRRAVQLGMKGRVLKSFATDWIIDIQDITPYVKEQRTWVNCRQLDKLMVPQENRYLTLPEAIATNIGIRD